jgi:CubicO group peptidase (beta-lactamase class C family)
MRHRRVERPRTVALLGLLLAFSIPVASAGPSIAELEALLHDESVALRLAAAAAIHAIRPPTPASASELAGKVDWLRAHLPELMREHHVPGASVAIVQRNELALTEGFGVRDARTREPVTTDTVFEVASLSKPVLALGALRLIQQRRLDLDTPLVHYLGHDYLADQPAHRLITARMALTHRTGFPDWRASDDETGPLPLLFTPGTRHGYSGEGILFLQRAMEAITGEPLQAFAQRELFEPLGLRHTGFAWSEAIERELASGHDVGGAFKRRTHYDAANGAYTLYTTPADYARLVLTLMRPDILGARAFTPDSIALMLGRYHRRQDAELFDRPGLAQGVAAYRALGWSIEVSAAGDIVQHTGSNSSGFKALVQFNRERQSALVLFTNGEGGAALRDSVVAHVGDL